MKRYKISKYLIFICIQWIEPSCRAQHAIFQALGDLPGGIFSSSVKGVSNDGNIIVGYGTTDSGEEAFRWTTETGMKSLGNLSGNSFKKSWAIGISADGSMIVGYGDPVGQGWNTYKGFVWNGEEGMHEIGTLDTSNRSMALCISGNGTVIAGDGGPAAFRWTMDLQNQRLGVLPNRTHSRIVDMSADGKVMIGQSYSLPAWDDEDGFIMKDDSTVQSMASLTGGKYCMVLCISPDGSVVAGTTHTSSYPAFFWTKEKGMITIGHLPEMNTTHPGDMTPYGNIIVGGSFSGPDQGDAFIWDSIHGIRNLKTVLQSEYGLDLTGWKLLNASGITPDGNVLVGDAINPQGQKEGFRVVLDTLINVRTSDLSLQYSTLIGGSGWDYGHGIAVDESGCAYVAGQANSPDYPATAESFDNSHNGNSDIFLTKLNQNGSALVYSTYIGGSGRDDTRKVFIDKNGCIYLSGSTKSSDFPFTSNALTDNSMGYFLKVNAAGDSLIYSNRLVDGGNVMSDLDGNLVVVGATGTPDFPTTENALFRKFAGDKDIFITKIDPVRNRIIFSTLIGGSGNDWAPAMTIDHENNIIIAGRTNSADFPLKGAAFGKFTQGKFNIIVAKIKADGSELLYSTIVGGTDDDWAFDITSDKNNDVYITGATKSGNFPVSKNAFDESYNGGDDAVLFKLNSTGTELKYSTYLGGSLKDGGRGIVVDQKGRAFLTGCSRSCNFPVTENAYDKTFNGAGTDEWTWGDPFLLVMNPEGSQIEYSTYFGGSNDEEAYGIAMDAKGDIYICGVTSSDDFPTTEHAYCKNRKGGIVVYAAKFSFCKGRYRTTEEKSACQTQQFTDLYGDYLGQTPPGDVPVIFAPGIVSGTSLEHSSTAFSSDGSEVYWASRKDQNDKISTWFMKRINNRWTQPQAFEPFPDSSGCYDPFFAKGDNRLYFSADGKSSDIWFVDREKSGWGKPQSISTLINSDNGQCQATRTKNGTLYFIDYKTVNDKWRCEIMRSSLKNGAYAQPDPLPGRINSVIEDWTPFIASDDSYLIFARKNNPSAYCDLYISFHDSKNDIWSEPLNMGADINTTAQETYPVISPDGKYLFFTRWTDEKTDMDVYWVSASIIDKLRKKLNFKN